MIPQYRLGKSQVETADSCKCSEQVEWIRLGGDMLNIHPGGELGTVLQPLLYQPQNPVDDCSASENGKLTKSFPFD